MGQVRPALFEIGQRAAAVGSFGTMQLVLESVGSSGSHDTCVKEHGNKKVSYEQEGEHWIPLDQTLVDGKGASLCARSGSDFCLTLEEE